MGPFLTRSFIIIRNCANVNTFFARNEILCNLGKFVDFLHRCGIIDLVKEYEDDWGAAISG